MSYVVRGVEYPNAQAVADAFGLSISTVHAAKGRGKLHNLGLGCGYRGPNDKKGGRPPISFTLSRTHFTSYADCANRLGVTAKSVQRIMSTGGELAKARLTAKVKEYENDNDSH